MSARKSDKNRIDDLKTEVSILKNDVAWLKKLGFAFIALLAFDILINLMSLKPIAQRSLIE